MPEFLVVEELLVKRCTIIEAETYNQALRDRKEGTTKVVEVSDETVGSIFRDLRPYFREGVIKCRSSVNYYST